MKADLIINGKKLVNVNIVDVKPYRVEFLWKRKYIVRHIKNIVEKYDISILNYDDCKDEYLCEYKGRFNIHTKKQAPFDDDGLMLKAELTRIRNRLQNFAINSEDKLSENEKKMFIDTISNLDLSIMEKYEEVRL